MKTWTKEDIKVLSDCIKESETLAEAARKAAIKLNKSEHSCEIYYYNHKELFKNVSFSIERKNKIKDILYKKISENPGNLQLAFKLAAKELDMNAGTLCAAYYSKDSYLSRHKNKTNFLLMSKETVAPNSKIFNGCVHKQPNRK